MILGWAGVAWPLLVFSILAGKHQHAYPEMCTAIAGSEISETSAAMPTVADDSVREETDEATVRPHVPIRAHLRTSEALARKRASTFSCSWLSCSHCAQAYAAHWR